MIEIKPEEIEKLSFRIITEELGGRSFDPLHEPIIKRVIHTTADFGYADSLHFSDGAVKAALEAVRNGADIVTDTRMAKAGISAETLKKSGGEAHCFIADEDVAKEAKERGVTRASVSMERAALIGKKLIFAIGNAPTALIKLNDLIQSGRLEPALVIAVPVGFVNVIESKELIMNCKVPVIAAKGRRGGSNVAAAIVNAILYMAFPRK